MTKKVLVLDIDGTLTTTEKKISPKTLEALIQIQEEGHIIVLASGRPTPGMRRYVDELQLAKYGGYKMSYNGACITDCKTGEIVYQQTLPQEVIPELYAFACEKHCGIMSYLGDSIISGNGIDKYVEIEARINGLPIREVEKFPEFITFAVNKCLMTAEPDDAEKYVDELNAHYGTQLSIYRSEPFFIEIMPQNIDKAASLDRMLGLIGMTQADTVCCGDGYNDISMIKYAHVGVAMANARDVVKEAADFITGSNDEDGLLTVIDKFV